MSKKGKIINIILKKIDDRTADSLSDEILFDIYFLLVAEVYIILFIPSY